MSFNGLALLLKDEAHENILPSNVCKLDFHVNDLDENIELAIDKLETLVIKIRYHLVKD